MAIANPPARKSTQPQKDNRERYYQKLPSMQSRRARTPEEITKKADQEEESDESRVSRPTVPMAEEYQEESVIDEEDEEQDGDTEESDQFFDGDVGEAEPQAKEEKPELRIPLIGGMIPDSLKSKLEELGEKALEDPALKQELHTFGWSIINFIFYTFLLALPFVTILLIYAFFQKNKDLGWKFAYNILSPTQKGIILGLNLAVFVILILLIAIIGAAYCIYSGKFILDSVRELFTGDETFCNSFGIIDIVKLYYE